MKNTNYTDGLSEEELRGVSFLAGIGTDFIKENAKNLERSNTSGDSVGNISGGIANTVVDIAIYSIISD